MTNKIAFEFTDRVAGYVSGFNKEDDSFTITTSDGRNFLTHLCAVTYARSARNLGEPYQDATGKMREYLSQDGRFVFVLGVFYPEDDDMYFEAKEIDFPESEPGHFRFEEPDWWINQAREICDSFLNAQFDKGKANYAKYRTMIDLYGHKDGSARQETDTISRMVYGMATAYMLTGEDRFLEAAENGTDFLLKRLSVYDVDKEVRYFYHCHDMMEDGSAMSILPSQNGEDYGAIPMYEQIYALAGPVQTMRVNGHPKVLSAAEETIALFDKYFKDENGEGYYSHIDPRTFSPHEEKLAHNKDRKNWNSVGDHAPAYLINLYLATGEEKYLKFLEQTFDIITEHFQDYESSPFVIEKFHEDWTPDLEWGWQQDRGVIGHNLKIAWNLMRFQSICPKESYEKFAKKIAETIPTAGMDAQRGGWYDVMERHGHHHFAWHDRKAWWQQEQGILAYEILYGLFGNPEYLKYAREGAAFYNTFFLDCVDGDVYFNVLADGVPYLLGTERFKGSHSKSCYHSVELAYLAAVYTNLLNTGKGLTLYFKPMTGVLKDDILRVQPDILPVGRVKIGSVEIDGKPWTDFDADALTVKIPHEGYRVKVKVNLVTVK
ncbi:MAG: AGE family epimerase/isomerase [Bacteroidales bacterium]|nr:AGE family epimerase/isomerase [Bacteroidales bacterium]